MKQRKTSKDVKKWITRDELIAHRLDVQETCAYTGADSLAYLPLETLREDLGNEAQGFCDACFSGDYPVPPEPPGPDSQLRLFMPDEGAAV